VDQPAGRSIVSFRGRSWARINNTNSPWAPSNPLLDLSISSSSGHAYYCKGIPLMETSEIKEIRILTKRVTSINHKAWVGQYNTLLEAYLSPAPMSRQADPSGRLSTRAFLLWSYSPCPMRVVCGTGTCLAYPRQNFGQTISCWFP